MKPGKGKSWWGLYLLGPVTVILLFFASRFRNAPTLRLILIGVVALVISLLALSWSEGHTDLMGSEGVNAQAEQDRLAQTGVAPGRFAPSRTMTQAHYRTVMLAKEMPAAGGRDQARDQSM